MTATAAYDFLEEETGRSTAGTETVAHRAARAVLDAAHDMMQAAVPRGDMPGEGAGPAGPGLDDSAAPGKDTVFLQFAENQLALCEAVLPRKRTARKILSPALSRLLVLLREEPVEDGYIHPGENLLEAALEDDMEGTCRGILGLLDDPGHAPVPVVADTVILLGRVAPHLCGDWAPRIAQKALEHPDMQVREAGIRALENWERPEWLEILESYVDDEVEDWLRSYADAVLDAMTPGGDEGDAVSRP